MKKVMSENNRFPSDEALIAAIAELEEERALTMVRARLEAGDDPLHIIDACREGMRLVGLAYEEGRYYLSGLIMGSEIFREVMELVSPVLREQISGSSSGRILLGTVQGDIHDLGKNIVNMLLTCHRFTVYDLGVDVSPDSFVMAALESKPNIIGLSGLLTTSYEAMRETIRRLREAGISSPIIIGGSLINESVREYVGADYWTTDAIRGVELCRTLISHN